MAVEFRLLGDVEVWRDAQPVPVGATGQRCMPPVLPAAANSMVPVDQLAPIPGAVIELRFPGVVPATTGIRPSPLASGT